MTRKPPELKASLRGFLSNLGDVRRLFRSPASMFLARRMRETEPSSVETSNLPAPTRHAARHPTGPARARKRTACESPQRRYVANVMRLRKRFPLDKRASRWNSPILREIAAQVERYLKPERNPMYLLRALN